MEDSCCGLKKTRKKRKGNAKEAKVKRLNSA
jgi:hypothetical protein